MSWQVSVDVKDLQEAERRIKSVISAVSSKDVEDVILGGAKIIQREARSRISGRVTGRLKASVRAKKAGSRQATFRGAFVAVDRKKAPYAHFYELGTQGRKHRSGKSVGRMPSRPFFWPAVQDTQGQVERHITSGLATLIGRAVK